jgi:hypothetical protein
MASPSIFVAGGLRDLGLCGSRSLGHVNGETSIVVRHGLGPERGVHTPLDSGPGKLQVCKTFIGAPKTASVGHYPTLVDISSDG